MMRQVLGVKAMIVQMGHGRGHIPGLGRWEDCGSSAELSWEKEVLVSAQSRVHELKAC